MKRLAFVLVLLSACRLPPEQRAPSATVRYDRGTLHVTGRAELPDGALMLFVVARERLTLTQSRKECTLAWTYDEESKPARAVVRDGAFSAELPVDGPGLYRVDIVNRSVSLDVVAGDPREIARELASEAKLTAALVERLRAPAPDLRSIEADATHTLHVSHVTRDAILQACARIDACRPDAPRLDYPPDSPEAQHVAAGCADLPSGVNLEWDLLMARVQTDRAAELARREPLLLPLRIAEVMLGDGEQALQAIEALMTELCRFRTP